MLRASYLNTMRGLEHGLCVGDIAVFNLETCSPDERLGDVQERVRRFDFDNVPVRKNGTIVGVVENIKGFAPDVRVGDVHTQLSEQMLVAASVPLAKFLPTIDRQPYRLVVAESGIRGVVTPSDVVQLPVRLLVFALLAHLEELMRAAIRQTEPDDDRAVAQLPRRRHESVKRTLKLQRSKDLNPAPLDVTQFIDKATLIFELGVVEEGAGDRDLFKELFELRNKVDHVDHYAETTEQLQRFLSHVSQLEAWIDRLSELLPDAPAASMRRP